MTMRAAIWRCERCNAYHVGGLDIEDTDNDGIRAVCGAEWSTSSGPDCALSEIPMVAVPVDELDDGECLHCGYPILIGSGAVVQCDMCGGFCCEDHHQRHSAYVHHDVASAAMLTGGACGACPHPENLHDERIRTVGDGVAPCSTCAVCLAVHTGHPDDDEPDDDEPEDDEPDDQSSRKEDARNGIDYDHSRAKEDARNASYRDDPEDRHPRF